MKKLLNNIVVLVALCLMATNAQAQFLPVTTTLQSAAAATGNGTAMNVDGYSTVGVQVTISNTATVTFEATQDLSAWQAVVCTLTSSTSATLVASVTATGTYHCAVSGMVQFRARVSAYTSGTVTVTATASPGVLGKGGGGGGGTQYAEDAAHASGDTGTMSLCVRRDANTTLADTTGDYAPCQVDANGNVKVNVVAGSSSGPSVAEDAAHTPGENIMPIGCRRIDSAATSAGTSGDWATVDCDANGAVRVRIDSTAVGAVSETDDNSVAQGTASHSVTLSIPYVNNGTDWERQRKWVYAEDAAHTSADTGSFVLTKRTDTAASSAGTDGDYASLNSDSLGLLWTRQLDPCSGIAKIFVAISQTTGTQLFTGTASNKTYVCGVHIVTATAQNIALVSGTGSVCATGTGAMAGGTTAATGWNLSANGGIVLGTGGATVAKSVANADNVCLLQSSTGQISGTISYVVAP